MWTKLFFALSALLFFVDSSAQENTDTSFQKTLDVVVVTGTRTENKVSNLPMPIQVISAKTIQLSGSQKLMDILQMQSGLVIANNPLGTALQGYPNPFGNGIQMQGLDPAYTLIMVDDEPLTGRNAGIVNLSRIPVNNIKQIEILKGPATSLYGSDALAGVINIITRIPSKNDLNIQTHYSTHNTLGINVGGGIKGEKLSFQFFGNRYSSDGYDLDKTIYGKTSDPFVDYSLNAKVIYEPNDRNQFILSTRYFSDKQFNNYLIFPEGKQAVVTGNTIETDKSIFGKWQHRINESLAYKVSLYATGYSNNAAVYLQKNDSLYEEIKIDQLLLKPELQVNIGSDPASLLVLGTGYNYETVTSNRYGDTKKLQSSYFFAQKQIHFLEKINVIAGLRYDMNQLYHSQLSPKIAIAWKVKPDFIIKGSVGAGFKAPDFRQQYLNFSNSLIGYSLIGARELGPSLLDLQKSGQIDASIDITPYLNGVTLSPEKSIGINIGFDWTIQQNTVLKLNLFRNDISNLIETYNLPFNKKNNQAIYSYMNLNRVYTEGLEFNFSHRFNKNFLIAGSYQYLIAKDKDVLKKIRAGQVYKRDPITLITTKVTESDYKGLYNRSKNTANLQFQYQNVLHKAAVYLTAKYRGRYGFSGLNGFQDGNDILDDDREFVAGFLMLNTTVSKHIGKNWQLQAGVENILDYTNKTIMPHIPGRTFFINCNFSL